MKVSVASRSAPCAHEITSREIFEQRRRWLSAAPAALALTGAALGAESSAPATPARLSVVSSPFSTNESLTPRKDVISYNNFYEFGTDKSDPAQNARSLRLRPWTVAVEGEVRRPRTYDIDELLRLAPLEERVYRMRCVEGWSMVIPWVGYSLAELIRRVEPTGNARYVEFTSMSDKSQMVGTWLPVLAWPYVEGLRLDEAMHPLTLLGLGLYGETLMPQNGAPVRVVVPWKYGFKSAKSIVRIRFTEKQPVTSWNRANPREYGFFSNVNPEVDHPRWSQASERRIGDGSLLSRKIRTLPFNGYAEQVASLYAGMDLRREF